MIEIILSCICIAKLIGINRKLSEMDLENFQGKKSEIRGQTGVLIALHVSLLIICFAITIYAFTSFKG